MERKEALEVVRKNMPTDRSLPVYEALQTLIPELAESEDERVMGDLIGGLMWQRDNLDTIGPHDNSLILPGFCLTVGEHLAYLEKQKEQKPADYEAELKKCKDNPFYFYDKYVSIKLKPAEWGEEDERMRQTAIEACKTVAEDYENSNERFYKCKYWLETKLKSLRPQPEQEWDTHDKAIVNCIVCCLDGQFVPEAARKQCLEWFNKHRRDFLNRPSWKPSEEQMKALKEVAYSIVGTGTQTDVYLVQLYEHLKKLI